VDQHISNINLDLRNKVTVHDLYNQLKSKANVEKVRGVEKQIK